MERNNYGSITRNNRFDPLKFSTSLPTKILNYFLTPPHTPSSSFVHPSARLQFRLIASYFFFFIKRTENNWNVSKRNKKKKFYFLVQNLLSSFSHSIKFPLLTPPNCMSRLQPAPLPLTLVPGCSGDVARSRSTCDVSQCVPTLGKLVDAVQSTTNYGYRALLPFDWLLQLVSRRRGHEASITLFKKKKPNKQINSCC